MTKKEIIKIIKYNKKIAKGYLKNGYDFAIILLEKK